MNKNEETAMYGLSEKGPAQNIWKTLGCNGSHGLCVSKEAETGYGFSRWSGDLDKSCGRDNVGRGVQSICCSEYESS